MGSDIPFVRGEAHENKGAENEHRGYWNEPAKIEPACVRGFALGDLCFGMRDEYSGFGLPGHSCHVQGSCWKWLCTRESWFEREIGLHHLPGAGARHCCELFAAARACGEMKLVSGGFVDAQRLVEIRGQEFGVGAIADSSRI